MNIIKNDDVEAKEMSFIKVFFIMLALAIFLLFTFYDADYIFAKKWWLDTEKIEANYVGPIEDKCLEHIEKGESGAIICIKILLSAYDKFDFANERGKKLLMNIKNRPADMGNWTYEECLNWLNKNEDKLFVSEEKKLIVFRIDK